MKKVIMIGEEPSKGVEFTHVLGIVNGWCECTCKSSFYDKIVYLGKCPIDGDMFATYTCDMITIYKGNLNNGTY
jgi:hypothetical protein